MAKINILDQDTINKIAAGEVVERPSSVVKELVENAIDAGATAVSVFIEGGGADLIRITDNGSGFDRDDIRIAFKKNTTSKIRCAEDLEGVMTLGFRGEALSSISAVAHVELLTKKPGEIMGSRYCISGGTEEAFDDVGCPDGSTIVVKDLFFNTPVRRKFLKSAMTEAGYVNDVCERIALAHPEVAIKFTSNGKQILSTTGKGNLKETVYLIYGRGTAEQLLNVNLEVGDMKITGVVARPLIARGNRNFENYFLNGRYIKNPIISKAIEEAYRTYMMQNKYPFTVLTISIPATKYDVNVHPAKLEVRFEEPQTIYEFVYKAVFEAVKYGDRIVESVLDEEEEKKSSEKPKLNSAPEPFEINRKTLNYEEIAKSVSNILPSQNNKEAGRSTISSNLYTSSGFTKTAAMEQSVYEKPVYNDKTNHEERVYYKSEVNYDKSLQPMKTEEKTVLESPVKESAEEPEDIANTENTENTVEQAAEATSAKVPDSASEASESVSEQLSFLSEEAVKEHKIIGQLFDTYWLIEYDQKLYIIDQHAAHERILYEKIIKEYKTGQVNSQLLYPAPVMELSLSEADKVNRIMPELNKLGYEIEHFGGREYRILAVPEGLSQLSKKEMLVEFIDNLTEDLISGSQESICDRLASMSCKAAIKGNTRISETEAKALINQLLKLENPFHCPHGRPIEISFSKYEIEKKFKRIV